MTVRAGTKIKFGCETDMGSKIRWTFNIPGQQLPRVIYSGFSLDSGVEWRMEVYSTARRNELIIRNVLMEDSGTYSCQELQNITRRVDFHLIVEENIIPPEAKRRSTTEQKKVTTSTSIILLTSTANELLPTSLEKTDDTTVLPLTTYKATEAVRSTTAEQKESTTSSSIVTMTYTIDELLPTSANYAGKSVNWSSKTSSTTFDIVADVDAA